MQICLELVLLFWSVAKIDYVTNEVEPLTSGVSKLSIVIPNNV